MTSHFRPLVQSFRCVSIVNYEHGITYYIAHLIHVDKITFIIQYVFCSLNFQLMSCFNDITYIEWLFIQTITEAIDAIILSIFMYRRTLHVYLHRRCIFSCHIFINRSKNKNLTKKYVLFLFGKSFLALCTIYILNTILDINIKTKSLYLNKKCIQNR